MSPRQDGERVKQETAAAAPAVGLSRRTGMSTLWGHQREAVMYARGKRDVILHLGMGCGKSRIAIEIIKEAILGKLNVRILICCPKAVCAAWAKQFSLWSPETRVLILDADVGTGADKEKALKSAMADTSPLVVVINYESAWRVALIEKTKWSVLVYDEVHRLKSPSGKASRWASRMGSKNPEAKRLGLSGTLISHGPLDAYGVYRAIESPECATFGQTYGAFKSRYAVTNPHVPGMVVRFVNQDEMQKKIADTTFYRRSEDVLDLPPIMHEDLTFELSPAERAMYRSLEKDFCALLRDKTITPKNAMVGALRMLQCCGGHITPDDEKVAVSISEGTPSKASRFAEWLEDVPEREPLVVFCRFTADLAAARKCLESSGRTVSELSGRMNNLAAWQAGQTDVLVTQIQSGGIGIDLTRAGIAVFYSIGYPLSEWLQAIARLHRPGQTKHTHIYSLSATLPHNTLTIEGRVYAALRERKEVVDDLVSLYRDFDPRRSVEPAR